MPSAMAFNTRASAFAAIDSGGGGDDDTFGCDRCDVAWNRYARARNVDSECQRHIFSAILCKLQTESQLSHYVIINGCGASLRREFPTNWKNTDDLTAKPSKSQIAHGIE